MIAKSRRMIGLIAVVVAVVGLFAPSTARAAGHDAFTDVQAFGNKKPTDAGAADPITGARTLYPKSLPYGANSSPGQLWVTGRWVGTPDGDGVLRAFVDVEVSDSADFPATSTVRSRSVTAQPVNDDALGGPDGVQGYFRASVNVTNLGTHEVKDAASTNPLERGESTLYVRVIAWRPGGTPDKPRSSDDIVLGSGTANSVTKFAGAPKDTYKPAISRAIFPPAQWCHLSGTGPSFPNTNINGGGNGQGNCGNFAPLPDLTWLFCNPTQVRSCRDGQNPDSSQPHGHAIVSGSVTDDTSGFGIASEVASVTIQMTQGANVVKEYTSIDRVGPTAGYGIQMSINDFEPNFPSGDPYVVKVTVKDAWGNVTTTQSSNITIYPW